MRIIFRADASLDIGTGHIMRCLTLADALRSIGAECYFICREHPGHLVDRIRARGYKVYSLSLSSAPELGSDETDALAPAHARWLSGSQIQDARDCVPILQQIRPDWLVVDHYALDARWESLLRPYCCRVMVIDDLADREHDCDLLLDQTFGRQAEDYLSLIPENCMLWCGAKYALLRSEFVRWRPYSLARREGSTELQHLLIAMGGVDQNNATGRVLDMLTPSCLPPNCRISVVMGGNAPWLDQVKQKAAQLSWPTSILVDVICMAPLMAVSDLAIGAAGATSWERCCLGLPTLLMVLANNQRTAAQNLERVGAVRVIDLGFSEGYASISQNIFDLSVNSSAMVAMTHAAADVVDGNGVERLVHAIFRVDHAA